MARLFSRFTGVCWILDWPAIAGASILIQLVVSYVFRGSPVVAACSQFGYLFRMLFASGICGWNAANSMQTRC
jgi:hypothetical protein